jgi:hypothetical protein
VGNHPDEKNYQWPRAWNTKAVRVGAWPERNSSGTATICVPSLGRQVGARPAGATAAAPWKQHPNGNLPCSMNGSRLQAYSLTSAASQRRDRKLAIKFANLYQLTRGCGRHKFIGSTWQLKMCNIFHYYAK